MNQSNVGLPATNPAIALWCMVNKNHVLVQKVFSSSLDRAVWHLPRIAADSDAIAARAALDQQLKNLGLDSIRRPVVELGSIFAGNHGIGELVRILALELGEPSFGKLPSEFGFFPLSTQRNEMSTDPEEQRFQIVDAMVWAGAQLYFSLPESRGRPKDYEIFGALGLHMLRDEYINLWYPEASRDLGAAGIHLALEVIDQQPTLKIEGRQALLDEDIFLIRSRLIDLARHAKGRFWITEILDGEETVLDFADANLASLLNLGSMS